MIIKKKIPSIIMYIISFIVLLLPWIPVGEELYTIPQFAKVVFGGEVPALLAEMGMSDYTQIFQVLLPVQIGVYGIFYVSAIVYVILCICEKHWRVNIIALFSLVTNVFLIATTGGIMGLGYPQVMTALVPLISIVLVGIELPLGFLLERWDITVKETKEFEWQEKEFKEEKERRLRFEGKYTKQFYGIVWKNFRKNWKDYLLLLICNIIIFACFVVGYGIQNVLSKLYGQPQLGMLNGIGIILKNAMIPMGIVYVFIMVMLFFYYIKCRARNYGVFLTLGMRRKTLYYFVALEYISVFLISLLISSAVGTFVLTLFVNNSVQFIGIALEFSMVGITTYLKAIATVLGITIVSMMAARNIFYDFNVGSSTDLRAIGEKMPMRFRKAILAVGVILCILTAVLYGNRDYFENVYLLLGFFVGLFVVIRYVMAEMLLKERRKPTYLNKLLPHNQLFHKSKTSTGYMAVLVVMQVCVLFYFAFQYISAQIADEPESLYPYDVVCLADDTDADFFGELGEKYDVEIFEYPALRVTAYDATEELERGGKASIQGQHIGISESTYHALKKYLEPSYEAKDLDLEGEEIYIIYQQDQTAKAHPIGYYIPVNKPTLHIGKPCNDAIVLGWHDEDLMYAMYDVKGEETGSLIGNFRQGARENIVVFSDEYFEEAKEFWKTTNISYGTKEVYPGEGNEAMNPFIHQGITKLVMMNVAKNQMEDLAKDMEVFEKKHLDEEERVYKTVDPLFGGIIDATVSYHYTKQESIKNLELERVMKVAANGLIIVLFFAMTVMILLIKMLSELDLNLRRAEFFKCMGMRKKDRVRNAKKEFFRYFFLIPTVIGAVLSLIFTVLIFRARMFAPEICTAYIGKMVLVWGAYLVLLTVVVWIMITIYERWIESRI